MMAGARRKGKASKIFEKLMGPPIKLEGRKKKKRYEPLVAQPYQPYIY